ncbi:MAG: hypothetical protein ACTSW1_07405 [Candidatus Hodarchaeales archaeon]
MKTNNELIEETMKELEERSKQDLTTDRDGNPQYGYLDLVEKAVKKARQAGAQGALLDIQKEARHWFNANKQNLKNFPDDHKEDRDRAEMAQEIWDSVWWVCERKLKKLKKEGESTSPPQECNCDPETRTWCAEHLDDMYALEEKEGESGSFGVAIGSVCTDNSKTAAANSIQECNCDPKTRTWCAEHLDDMYEIEEKEEQEIKVNKKLVKVRLKTDKGYVSFWAIETESKKEKGEKQ